MSEINWRKLDALLAERLFEMKAVASDWPCYLDDEPDGCGEYLAAVSRKPFSKATPDYVYALNDHGWPPRPYPDEWAHGREQDPNEYMADVKPVPFISSEADWMIAVMEVMWLRGWEARVTRCHRGWRARMSRLSDGPSLVKYASGDTAPRAVALAARRALREAELTAGNRG